MGSIFLETVSSIGMLERRIFRIESMEMKNNTKLTDKEKETPPMKNIKSAPTKNLKIPTHFNQSNIKAQCKFAPPSIFMEVIS